MCSCGWIGGWRERGEKKEKSEAARVCIYDMRVCACGWRERGKKKKESEAGSIRVRRGRTSSI